MMNEFIITKEYKRFAEFCKACIKEKYMGLCYGPAGVGKSMSAVQFAKWGKVEPQVDEVNTQLSDVYGVDPIPDIIQLNTVIYVPEVISTIKTIQQQISLQLYGFNKLKEKALRIQRNEYSGQYITPQKNHVELLIIDEADRLQPRWLEHIRDVYDRAAEKEDPSERMAVIFIGMPGIEKRLIRFPQLYSRIGFVHAFKALTHDEVAFIIQHHCQTLDIEVNLIDFMDHEAIATVTRITHGNFRLINRLLKQTLRIIEVNQLSYISKEVIEAARECLVIGNVY